MKIYFMILVLTAVFILGCSNIFKYASSAQNSNTENSTSNRYFCGIDSDCVEYGTCRLECVNNEWSNKNPDAGPFCELLLPDFECKCLGKKCAAVKSSVSSCTNDVECDEGFSCWYAVPAGPARGIPGSKENPGRCWSNKVIQRIV